MEVRLNSPARYLIGDLVLDTGKRQLRRGTTVLDLPKLSYRMVLALVETAPNMLTVEELAKRVWPGRIVSPETVTQRIKLVRQALGDDAHAPRYIGLVRGEGYRLLVEVQADVDIHVDGQAARIDARSGPANESVEIRDKRKSAAFGLLLIGAVTGLFLLFDSRNPESPTIPAADTPVASTKVPAPNTIAVLPFANASGNPDDQYMSDGLADELRDQLGQVGSLRVAARTSSIMFHDEAVDALTIAERLSVAKLIEGALRRQGDRLRITVQIIDGRSGFQDWTQNYDRPDTDILTIQQEIASEVVNQLLPTAAAAELAAVPATLIPSAHELMLLARYYYHQVRDDPIVNVQLLLRAIDLYRRATLADPKSALAQSRYAAALLYYGDVDLAEAPILRALEIDPDLSEVQYTLGLYFWSRHEPGAGQAYRRAIVLNPDNADALEAYAMWLWHQPDTGLAETYFRRALDIDPMSVSRYAAMGNFFGVTGQRDEAITIAEQIQARFDDAQALMTLARIYELTGDLDVAIAWALTALNRHPNYVVASWMLAELYARIGDDEAAIRFEPDLGFSPLYYQRRYEDFIDLTEELVLERPGEIQLWFGLARAYLATGRYEQAIRVLQQQGLPEVVFVDSRRANAIEAMVTLADAMNERGEEARARELASWLNAFFQAFADTGAANGWWPHLYQACALSILGDDQKSLEALEHMAATAGLPWYPVVRDAPCFRKFAINPRYLAVVSSMDARKAELRRRLPDTLARFQTIQ